MTIRLDHDVISRIIDPGTTVLDLGCGNGELMFLLAREKGAIVQGIELNVEAVQRCVENGLAVFQGDIESGLADCPECSFGYVILNQSMQEVKKVDFIIDESLRVGKQVIVGFPNFAHYSSRFRLFLRGRAPVILSLPYLWYETPNVRFLSIKDFKTFCQRKKLKIRHACYLGNYGIIKYWPNLFAKNAIFVLTR
jgi:methionine biosynthesis protein MetW